jgi:hypothetical protein
MEHGPTSKEASESLSIRFVDHQRKPGQTLLNYQVVDQGPRSSTRQFGVKLSLDHPAESVTASYVVFGRSPCWVYRLEDFDMIMHWEHPMSAQAAPELKSQTVTSPSGNGGLSSNQTK